MAAYFSLPWALACAVVRKKVGISEFTEESLNDVALLNMAAKVNPVLDPSLTNELAPTKVKIRTKRGTFAIDTGYARGSIQNPMTFEDIEYKLMDCASAYSQHISKKNLVQASSMVRNLEDAQDVRRIIHLVAQSS